MGHISNMYFGVMGNASSERLSDPYLTSGFKPKIGQKCPPIE